MGFIKGGDARVFANCKLQESFTFGNFKLFYKELFPGFECVSQLLLGDSVCSLLSHIMKEHEHCSSKAEVIFNQCSGVRNMTESGFSCLKARWRILLRPIDIPVEKLLNIIYACFVLHNFCEKATGEVDAYLVEKIAQEERRAKLSVDKLNSYTSLAGRKVKETIISFFKEYL